MTISYWLLIAPVAGAIVVGIVAFLRLVALPRVTLRDAWLTFVGGMDLIRPLCAIEAVFSLAASLVLGGLGITQPSWLVELSQDRGWVAWVIVGCLTSALRSNTKVVLSGLKAASPNHRRGDAAADDSVDRVLASLGGRQISIVAELCERAWQVAERRHMQLWAELSQSFRDLARTDIGQASSLTDSVDDFLRQFPKRNTPRLKRALSSAKADPNEASLLALLGALRVADLQAPILACVRG